VLDCSGTVCEFSVDGTRSVTLDSVELRTDGIVSVAS